MIIEVNGRPLNLYLVLYYYTRDEKKDDGSTSYNIYYRLTDGRVIQEEFTSESDRSTKIEEYLENASLGGGLVQANTYAELPDKGDGSFIYIVKDTGQTYYWDEATTTYVKTGTTGRTGVYSTQENLAMQIGSSVTLNKTDLTEIVAPTVAFMDGSDVIDTKFVHGIIVSSTNDTVTIKTVTDAVSRDFIQVTSESALPSISQTLENELYFLKDIKEFRVPNKTSNTWEKPYNSILTSLEQSISTLNTNKEDKSNKVTSMNSSSTNVQYPSAKAVYDELYNNNLLHYKGHVATVDDLPSSGQPSGTLRSPYYTINDYAYNASIGNKFTESEKTNIVSTIKQRMTEKGHNKSYYIGLWCTYSTSTPYYAYLSTDYPEIIKGVALGTPSSSSIDNSNYYIFYVEASPEKPVYFGATGVVSTSSWLYMCYTYLDGTGGIGTENVATQPVYIMVSITQFRDRFIVGNIPNQIKYKIPTISTLHYDYGIGQDRTQSYTYARSARHTYTDGNGYITNDSMNFFSFDSNEIITYNIGNADPNAIENNVYTVGQNNDIYRCNSTPAWELWSRGEVSQSDLETTISNIAPTYDNTQTYNEGDYTIYNNQLYVCNTDIQTAEDFDSTKWDTTTVAEILGNIKSLLGGI